MKAREREALPCKILAPGFEMKSSPGTVVALYVMALDCDTVEKSFGKGWRSKDVAPMLRYKENFPR